MPDKEFLSLADLDQIQDEELQGFDPTADANAFPPPVPAGVYVVKVAHQEEDPDKYWEKKISKDGSPYYNTNLSCTIVENPANDPKFVGRRVPHMNCMTLVRYGTTGVQAVLQGLGKGEVLINAPRTGTVQAKALSNELVAEPLVGVETDWEASDYDKDQDRELHPRVRGMHRFPDNPEKPGEKLPVYTWEDGTEANARNYIARFVKLEDVAKRQEQLRARAASHTAVSAKATGAGAKTTPAKAATTPVATATAATAKPAAAPARAARR